MKYRKLGKTDIDVSVICLGTMTWGNQNNEAEGHVQMDYAYDRGVNFWDTAELYAVPASKETSFETERIIGTWIKKNKEKRDKLVLSSKIAGPGPYTYHIREANNYPPENIIEAVEGSLMRMNIDTIDLYQFHWPARGTNCFGVRDYVHNAEWEDDFLGRIETMSQLIKAGKIKHFGVSNETPWGLSHYLQLADKNGLPRPVSIQNPYSLLNRLFEIGLAEISMREQISLMAYSPLAFGTLTGKYYKKRDKPTDRLNTMKTFARYGSPNSESAIKAYVDLADEHKLNPTQMALSFVNDREFATSTIIGATNLEQLKENIDSIELELDSEIRGAINKIHNGNPNPAP